MSPIGILVALGSIGSALHIAQWPVVQIRDTIPTNPKYKQNKATMKSTSMARR